MCGGATDRAPLLEQHDVQNIPDHHGKCSNKTCFFLIWLVIVVGFILCIVAYESLQNKLSSQQDQVDTLTQDSTQCEAAIATLQGQVSTLSLDSAGCKTAISMLQDQTSREWIFQGYPALHIFPATPALVTLNDMSVTIPVKPDRFYRISGKIPISAAPPTQSGSITESMYQCFVFLNNTQVDVVWHSSAPVSAGAWFKRDSLQFHAVVSAFLQPALALVEFKCTYFPLPSGVYQVQTDNSGENSFFVEISEFFADSFDT